MSSSVRALAAITVLNAAFAVITASQWHPANAADDRVADVLRARKLEIVDEAGRVRASIVVHAAKPPQDDAVVLRLINGDGMPGVKLAISERNAGLALVREQGNYVQVSANGVKLTSGGRQRAAWP